MPTPAVDPERRFWHELPGVPLRAEGTKVALERRGVDHGSVVEVGWPERTSLDDVERLRALWDADRPIHLVAALNETLAPHRRAIRATREVFEHIRDDERFDFADEVWRRLGEEGAWEPAGATIDLGDEREIEKVFANFREDGRRVARDLYAKLSWISHDESDASLRIRFSFGAEALLEWQQETRRAPFADRLAEALFPECGVITDNAPLTGLIDALLAEPARLSERIVYSNAPGGGAVFHNDDEKWQRGVVYGQLAGETAWLALPKRDLADELVASAAGGPLAARLSGVDDAMQALEDESFEELARLLNHDAAFTGRLVERGAFRLLRTGDALLLPSHGPDDVCWHSVFAVGDEPSLAHSYGIFPRDLVVEPERPAPKKS